MNLKQLKDIVNSLPPELDNSVILVNSPGLSPPVEPTRIIKIPKIYNVNNSYSTEYYLDALWLTDGGAYVSGDAELEGWTVPVLIPDHTPPSGRDKP